MDTTRPRLRAEQDRLTRAGASQPLDCSTSAKNASEEV